MDGAEAVACVSQLSPGGYGHLIGIAAVSRIKGVITTGSDPTAGFNGVTAKNPATVVQCPATGGMHSSHSHTAGNLADVVDDAQDRATIGNSNSGITTIGGNASININGYP